MQMAAACQTRRHGGHSATCPSPLKIRD